MATVREELENFHKFAAERLSSEPDSATLDELLMQWHDLRERDAINSAIRRGIEDVEQGRFEPAERSLEALRREFGRRDE